MIRIDEREMKRHYPSKKKKCVFGEVHTPFSFIEIMLKMLPDWVYMDQTYTWLDPCCGRGYFMMTICNALYKHLAEDIPHPEFRRKHILKNMIHMCEIQESYEPILRYVFGDSTSPHIHIRSFLDFQPETDTKYDVIIGNPPFNINGRKPNPSNYLYTQDGVNTQINSDTKEEDNLLNEKTVTIWPEFIRKSYDMLKDGGFLCMVVPSIWLKPDKMGIHDFIFSRKHTIFGIRSFSCSEIMRMFDKQVQTPMSIIALRKLPNPFANSLTCYLEVPVFDHFTQKTEYIQYNQADPIPMHTPSIVNKLLIHARRLGTLPIIKTNPPKKTETIAIPPNTSSTTSTSTSQSVFYGVRSCCFQKNNALVKVPVLTLDKSTNIPYPYSNQPKLIMAHKMYGLPYYDEEGMLGISTRDNYLLLQNSPQRTYSKEEMVWLEWFLGSPIALFLYDTTRYRMRYLEKYAFQYIPDLIDKELNGYQINPIYMFDDRVLCYALGLTEEETKFVMGNYPRYRNTVMEW